MLGAITTIVGSLEQFAGQLSYHDISFVEMTIQTAQNNGRPVIDKKEHTQYYIECSVPLYVEYGGISHGRNVLRCRNTIPEKYASYFQKYGGRSLYQNLLNHENSLNLGLEYAHRCGQMMRQQDELSARNIAIYIFTKLYPEERTFHEVVQEIQAFDFRPIFDEIFNSHHGYPLQTRP